ncbi:hypothetical protein K438DRAFT_1960657 [Mycena galopus ATCC 62051]|nr:hypothetical protein K438DRAFT_1960657 [Mycena galopus ATCC 62051]
MSSIATSPTFQEIFRVPLDNRDAPQTISLNSILLIVFFLLRSDYRAEELPAGRNVVVNIVFQQRPRHSQADVRFIPSLSESNEDQSNAQARRTRDSSPTTAIVSPPPFRRNGSATYLYPPPSTSSAALPGATGGGGHDEPLPAYSRLPPVYSATAAPDSVCPSAALEFPSPDVPQFTPIPLIAGDRRETRRRRLVSAILDDDSEEERPELPIGDDGGYRRRSRSVYEEDDNDEEEERYAKRSRVSNSWTPWRFVRSLWV